MIQITSCRAMLGDYFPLTLALLLTGCAKENKEAPQSESDTTEDTGDAHADTDTGQDSGDTAADTGDSGAAFDYLVPSVWTSNWFFAFDEEGAISGYYFEDGGDPYPSIAMIVLIETEGWDGTLDDYHHICEIWLDASNAVPTDELFSFEPNVLWAWEIPTNRVLLTSDGCDLLDPAVFPNQGKDWVESASWGFAMGPLSGAGDDLMETAEGLSEWDTWQYSTEVGYLYSSLLEDSNIGGVANDAYLVVVKALVDDVVSDELVDVGDGTSLFPAFYVANPMFGFSL